MAGARQAYWQALQWMLDEMIMNPDSAKAYLQRLEAPRHEDERHPAALPERYDAEAHYQRGLSRAEAGEWQEAMADFDRALKLRPDYVDALNKRGQARYELGDLEDAICDFEAALKLKPDHTLAYINLAVAKTDRGDFVEGARKLEEAKARNPIIINCQRLDR